MATRIKVKRILELLEKDPSSNEIAKTYNISKHSIRTVRMRASELGVSYEKAKEQSEEELGKVGVTLKLLHDEYAEDCRKSGKIADGYSKFCRDYGRFPGTRNFANHIIHKPGDRIEVDWNGPAFCRSAGLPRCRTHQYSPSELVTRMRLP